ncbi:uncharacterized protein LOC118431990 [Branchiostoma floridae]|uniref:Uncharacterized protein LOC118431990 n=1 Tax=Branchiostoma floridae TaxID=7739 RepID=A0A9J7NDI9_BRAFL|nr:uncharacterized protein LOC118431990 [Branchiostoma floridae]
MKHLTLPVHVFALFAVCYGQQHCCYPDQYDLRESETGWNYGPVGGVSSYRGSRHVVYDFVHKKLAIEERTDSGGVRQYYKMIYDYPEGAHYLIMGTDCFKTKLTGDMKQHCIPGQASHVGSYVYGAGDSGVLVDAFLFQVKGNVTSHREVTRAGCLPVRELHTHLEPDDKTISMQSFTYENVTTTVEDPSVFTPPVPPCPPRHQFTQDVQDPELLQWIEKTKREQRISDPPRL